MATKHRGKAAQAAYAKKQGEKMQRARENYNPEAAKREAEADHDYVLAQARLGRPTLTGETLTVQQVRLTAAQIATARRLGAGNLSAGVRAALDRLGESWAVEAETRRKKR